MKANPRHSHFTRALERNAASWFGPWKGECWRFQDASFPTGKQILSGQGALENGGRLNHKGSFPVVYGSCADETALNEANARFRRYGLVVRSPRILVCFRLELQKVLDLTQPKIRRGLGVTLKEFGEENWERLQDVGIESLGQALGRAASELGAEAIVIPSFAQRGGVNVAFLPENRRPDSEVKIWDASKLPKASRPQKKRRK